MNRAYAIDVLRGLAIIGMVLSGQILWHADLPAWLFHAQVPPPNFKFDPSVFGITWVDLVFPFFLFSMGAAFPLSLRKKIERGVSLKSISTNIIKRGFLLALFAIALANTRAGVLKDINEYLRAALLLVTWGLFFCMFFRIPNATQRKNNMLNAFGVIGIIALMLIYKFVFKFNISVERSDIIILILANMAWFGTTLWLFTRNNIAARFCIIAIIVAMKISITNTDSWNYDVWNYSPIPWLYKMEFLKYLVIVLLGSIVGDKVYDWMQSKSNDQNSSNSRIMNIATILISAIFIVNAWGLFARQLIINVSATIVLGSVVWQLLKMCKNTTDTFIFNIFKFGFFLLLLGLTFEAYEGGIRKDHATISYFFVTSGLACFVMIVSTVLINYHKIKLSPLVLCGQNPMVAYTASGYIIMPVLTLTMLAPMLAKMAAANPWLGVLRGVIVTTLMMIITILFTRKKLFWRT